MAAILTSKTMELAPGVTIPDHDAFKVCFIVGAGAAISGALSRSGGIPGAARLRAA